MSQELAFGSAWIPTTLPPPQVRKMPAALVLCLSLLPCLTSGLFSRSQAAAGAVEPPATAPLAPAPPAPTLPATKPPIVVRATAATPMTVPPTTAPTAFNAAAVGEPMEMDAEDFGPIALDFFRDIFCEGKPQIIGGGLSSLACPTTKGRWSRFRAAVATVLIVALSPLSPLTSRLSPLASPLLPLASRLSPLASALHSTRLDFLTRLDSPRLDSTRLASPRLASPRLDSTSTSTRPRPRPRPRPASTSP